MPLYYFHIYNTDITIDEEGQELPDLDAARATAVSGARDLICQDVRNGEVTLSHRIEVADADNNSLFTVTYGEAVRINS